MLNSEKLKAFSLRSGIRKCCPFSPLVFNIVLAILATVIKQEKKNVRNPNWKGIHKMSLFADDMILYIENLKDTNKKLLETINISVKLQDTKLIYRNWLYFFTLTVN